MKFADLPPEIRLCIADHLEDWPDHKAFRQADRTNFSILTNTRLVSTRKRFRDVEEECVQEAVLKCMETLAMPSDRGMFSFLRQAAGTSEKRSIPQCMEPESSVGLEAGSDNLVSEKELTWLSFVHRNDLLAEIRPMFHRDAVFSNHALPWSTSSEAYSFYWNKYTARHIRCMQAHGGCERASAVRTISSMLEYGRKHLNPTVDVEDGEFKVLGRVWRPYFRDSPLAAWLRRYVLIELHSIYDGMAEVDCVVIGDLEKVGGFRDRATEVVEELKLARRLWDLFNDVKIVSTSSNAL
ncbi:hypothetical protein BJ508DRAFT_304269 [Ascobolus immersus RN42]|uniref:Uncharacterized protein n=1 Tax=Ascobolus immersus RN42 TaxID=1160509 RepID=A0A3N4IET5_ASCIM|nr:hypothetical protein BJ508DRAFT_304269 [Ascobolus immersus RN42]